MIIFHPSEHHRSLIRAILQVSTDVSEVKPVFETVSHNLVCTDVGAINLLGIQGDMIIYYLLYNSRSDRRKIIMHVGTRLSTQRITAQRYVESLDAYPQYLKAKISGLVLLKDPLPHRDGLQDTNFDYSRVARVNHIDMVFQSVLMAILRDNIDGNQISQSLQATFDWKPNLKIERDYITRGLRFQSTMEARTGATYEDLVTSLLHSSSLTPTSDLIGS